MCLRDAQGLLTVQYSISGWPKNSPRALHVSGTQPGCDDVSLLWGHSTPEVCQGGDWAPPDPEHPLRAAEELRKLD